MNFKLGSNCYTLLDIMALFWLRLSVFNRLWLLPLLVYLFFSTVLLFQGKIHVDEGTYLASAALLADGKLPYIDYLYLQMPVFPFIYGGLFYIIGSGLLKARLISMLFGFACLLLTMMLASKIQGREAAILAATLFALCPMQAYYFMIARIFSMASFFLVLGIYLVYAGKGRYWYDIAGASAVTLSVLTRLTLAPMLLMLLAYILLRDKRLSRGFIYSCLASLVIIAISTVPFLIAAPQAFIYCIIGFHLELKMGVQGNPWLAKLRIIADMLWFYAPLVVLGMLAVYGWLRGTIRRGDLSGDTARFLMAIMGGLLVVLLGHLSAKYSQSSYQTVIFPVAVLLVAIALINYMRIMLSNTIVIALLIISALISLSSLPRFMSDMDHTSAMGLLGKQKRILLKHLPVGSLVISSDTPLLPIEAGMSIHTSFVSNEYFPDYDTRRCRQLHLVNDEILLDLVKSGIADGILIQDYSYTLAFPNLKRVPLKNRERIIQAIARRYRLVETMPNLYNKGIKTYLYIKR